MKKYYEVGDLLRDKLHGTIGFVYAVSGGGRVYIFWTAGNRPPWNWPGELKGLVEWI
jgi:hypothetical protein|tara:strand:- start:912 stop:1082 length:171 start_codon:yes stop_codon:yes gene_type:complete